MKDITCRVVMKHDTYENWMEYNPILLDGEIAIVKIAYNIIKLKVGDGERHFSELPFVSC